MCGNSTNAKINLQNSTVCVSDAMSMPDLPIIINFRSDHAPPRGRKGRFHTINKIIRDNSVNNALSDADRGPVPLVFCKYIVFRDKSYVHIYTCIPIMYYLRPAHRCRKIRLHRVVSLYHFSAKRHSIL